MPANLSPEYKKAEAAYRRARDPHDQLELLREMLRTIPKHKGTEHMRADIKSRVKELTESVAGGRTGGAARTGPPTVIRPDGAAQIALIGPPNSGKSSLHAVLTRSHTVVGDYPFTTQFPQPGMLDHEDVHLQLVDLPPIAEEHPVPWIANAIQTADASMLVIDLSHPGCVAEVVALHDLLEERRVHLTPLWDGHRADGDDDPFAIVVPTLMIANKIDALADPAEELLVFRELTGYAYDAVLTSAVTGEGLDRIGPMLWDRLDVVRVYTKLPGQKPDMGRPFTVREGDTVQDVALLVHKDIAARLRFARIWSGDDFDGRQVGPDHVVTDGEVVELHI